MRTRSSRPWRSGIALLTVLVLLLRPVAGIGGVSAQSDSSTTGVSGNTYTSPSFGYSLSWDGSWTVKDEKVQDAYNMLRLDDDGSFLYIEGYSPAIDDGDCVQKYGIDYVTNIDGTSDFANTDPVEKSGVTSSDLTFTYTFTDDSGAKQTADMAGFVSCQTDSDADANIVVTHIGSAEVWDDETTAREKILATLTLSGDESSTPPVAEPTQAAGSSTSDQGGTGSGRGQVTEVQGDGTAPDNVDDLLELISTSTADIDAFWAREFPILTHGLQYVPPKSFIPWVGSIDTPCGVSESFDEATGQGSGPFYCPVDQNVYIDLGFANYQLDAVGKVPFLIPVVLAHEIGHHVQTLLGMEDCVQTPCLDPNQLTSQEIEYMADCYAGSWSQDAELRGRLGSQDVDANIVQYALLLSGGENSADPGGHGRGAERIWWFLNGYLQGTAKCFEASNVTKNWAQTGPPNPSSLTDPNATPEDDSTPSANDEPTETPAATNADVSQMGDDIDSDEGTLSFTSTDAQTSVEGTDADGVFLIVYFQVDRPENATGPFPYTDWTATDSDGNAYQVDTRATDLLLKTAYDDGIDEDLAGGQSYNVAMIFDVPTDASGFTLTNDAAGITVALDK